MRIFPFASQPPYSPKQIHIAEYHSVNSRGCETLNALFGVAYDRTTLNPDPQLGNFGQPNMGGYWADQIGPFAEHYRAIAYSRRYNYPNINPARSGYSAVVDAEDLAAFIHALHLGKVVVIGHSYGALAALFLAVKHPELVRALVLAEPPAAEPHTNLRISMSPRLPQNFDV